MRSLQARLKFRDLASLRALPYPALKVSKRLAWPDSSWGVRLRWGRQVAPNGANMGVMPAAGGKPGRAPHMRPHMRLPGWAGYVRCELSAQPTLQSLPPCLQLRVPAGGAHHLLPPARPPAAGH